MRILYEGEYDLAGESIEENTRRVLERATATEFDAHTWERVAPTQEQTAELRANGMEPIRKTDNRYRDGRPHEAFEAEALGQGTT